MEISLVIFSSLLAEFMALSFRNISPRPVTSQSILISVKFCDILSKVSLLNVVFWSKTLRIAPSETPIFCEKLLVVIL